MKKALIDTDILSFYLKGDEAVVGQVMEYLAEHPRLSISYISYFEIVKGLEYKKAKKQIAGFEKFASQCHLLNIDIDSIKVSARIYGNLRRKGITIGTSDLFIAGIAVQHGYQLITNNTKHFASIGGLSLASWKQ